MQGIHSIQDPLQKKLYLNLLEEANGLINSIENEQNQAYFPIERAGPRHSITYTRLLQFQAEKEARRLLTNYLFNFWNRKAKIAEKLVKELCDYYKLDVTLTSHLDDIVLHFAEWKAPVAAGTFGDGRHVLEEKQSNGPTPTA